MKALIVIKSGRNLPKLGLTNLPSPYIIMQVAGKQDVTKICQITCNPSWNYQTEIIAQDPLQKVTFYVYNNNPNYVDELLGYGSTQFETFMTPTVTNSRVMLRDSQGNYLNSYIQLQHSDANPPPSDRSILNQRTTIRINLLGITAYNQRTSDWVSQFKNKNVILGYGNQIKHLNQNIKIGTLLYDQTQSQILVRLQLSQKVVMKGFILFDNIRGNCSLRLKLYYNTYQVVVLIGASIIQNGLLPQKHNISIVQITSVIIQPLKKVPKEWTIAIHGAFGRQIINNIKQPIRIYIENNTSLQFQYFDQKIDKDNVINYQPLASLVVPINSIDWSETLNSTNNIKMYNPARGIIINIDIKYTLLKNTTQSKLLPKFDKPITYNQSQKAIYKISQMKMSGACFSEIFPDKTMLTFVYISNLGVKTIFSSFLIKNSTEYSILCRQNITESGLGGILYLVTYDLYFGNAQSNQNQFQNYIILKIICKNLRDLADGHMVFNDKFLSFAKKQTLVKPCKRFDQMVKDKLLTIKLTMKRFACFQPGFLTIQNCIVEGTKNKVELSIIFDSNELNLQGDSGNYMLTKAYTIKLKDNGVQFKIKNEDIIRQVHYEIQQILGEIQQNKIYLNSIPLGQGIVLKLIYSYKLTKIEKVKQKIDKIERFQTNTALSIKIKCAFAKTEGLKSFHLRVNKASTIYQTLQQNPTSTFIRFRDCQIMHFEKSAVNNYIFFNLYCNNGQGGLIIYAGHYNVKNIIGRGFYQIVMSKIGEQQNKNMALLIFEVLNNVPLVYPVVKLSIKQIRISHQQFVKNIMKYYLVAEVKNATVGIFELNRSNQVFLTNQNVFIKNGQAIVWRLYSSSKILSKEGFWSSQKELIASCKQMWASVEPSGVIQLRFQSPKELNSKLSSNKLALIQNYVIVFLQYACEPQQQAEILPNNRIAKPLDIQVLPSGAAKVNILQIVPYSSHQKTIQMKLMPFQFQFCAQSRMQLNKQFILQLPNMKAKMSLIRSSKLKDKYNKEVSHVQVNFRGKKYKTMEKIGFSVVFPGLCIMKADAVIYNSKFTSNANGELKLLQFGCNTKKIKQVQIYALKSAKQIRRGLEKTSSIKLNLNDGNSAPINRSFPTNQVTFCLHFVLSFEDKQKIRSTIQIAQINIQKLQNKPFRHQWVVQSKGVYVLYIQGQYNSVKVQQVTGQTANYNVQIGGQMSVIPIQYKTLQKLSLLNKVYKMDSFRPDRKRGFRIIVDLPKLLEASSLSIVLHDDSILPLRKVEHNTKSYIFNSQKEYKVKTIQINSQQIEKIEQLEQKNFSRRFLINRNPLLVVYLSEQHYAIADCQPQSVTVNFQFHKIYSKQVKNKIMWVKSNRNDQILTRHFGLLVKHGKQQKLIRSIDQNGQFQRQNNSKQSVSFGFDPLSDQLQLFLYIDHVLNQNQQAKSLDCQNLQNWTKLFPVAYGKITLQKIAKNVLIGCQMKKIQNFNETLDRPLNKIFQMPNLFCLGAVSMQKRYWGIIELQLEEISAIQLDFPSQSTLIYFDIEIQSSQRNKIAGMVTQARNLNKQKLTFVTKSLNFLYMQQKGQSQSLKIVANLLTINNSYKLFQKRVDISEYLRQPGRHPIKTQIKPLQCQGSKNLIQIKLNMNNSSAPTPQLNMMQQGKKINKIDVVSFQNYKQKQLMMKLLQCQLPSHLLQVLNQVKQSVIYSKQSQFQLFRMCGHYLQFQNDDKIISILIEMMNVQVFKYPQTINSLDQKDIIKIYEYIKIIFCSKRLQLPKLQKKLTTSDYDTFLQKIDLSQLDQNIKFQKRKLYSREEFVQSAMLSHAQQILPILEAFIEKSEAFKAAFKKDINQWNQSAIHKQGSIFHAFINQSIPTQILEDLIKKCLQKQINNQPIIDLWSKLPKQKMKDYAPIIFNKFISKFDNTKESQERVQTFRTFINYLQAQKIQIPSQNWIKVLNKCAQIVKSSTDFIILNLYSDLILKINSFGLINQSDKNSLISTVKKRNMTQNDKNLKIILGNLIDKLVGKKQITTQEATNAKNQFFKKYLITS